MIGKLCRGKAFGAQCPLGNGAIGITGNFCDFAVFYIDDYSAPAVAHATVALDYRIIIVYFHLPRYIRISNADSSSPLYNPVERSGKLLFALLITRLPTAGRDFKRRLRRFTSFSYGHGTVV